MSKVLACDSKPFERHMFKGVIGAVLSFDNLELFNKNYQEFMKSYCVKVGLQSEREILKSLNPPRG
ncbi:MAG: hypothetical protein M1165_00095 [Candidatus Pacearchaeota archaeon]|nr:hypothetical protein [Candidatus Pacearchaeota archaeon]